jgi:imidazolonepropionase-like amidohydrolase
LYIENQLPNYKLFTDKEAKMTIGTDSLTSNWQLSISEEIKTILKYCSYLSFDQLIKWACLNGAEALGFDQDLGSIEKGKTPGLIHWEIKDKNIQTSTINRII